MIHFIKISQGLNAGNTWDKYTWTQLVTVSIQLALLESRILLSTNQKP